jgi:hypothetical protein
LRRAPAAAFGGGVSIDMYPVYVAADALGSVVTTEIDSRTALRADDPYRLLMMKGELYPCPL